MKLRLNLRQKMAVLVGAVALSFVFSIAMSWALNLELSKQTAVIRNRYIPLVELGYRFETQFDALNLGLRDAVAAQDAGGLKDTRELKDKFLADLKAAEPVLGSDDVKELNGAIENYFSAAYALSEKLIRGETGLPVVADMTGMQSKRIAAEGILKKVTAFDRGKLANAFETIAKAQEHSADVGYWVSVSCFVFIFSLALLMGRNVMTSLKEISQGLIRFGDGDFKQPIRIIGKDELSELSHRLNRMAEQIQSLVREIESFSYSVAHDLRAPLRSMIGFSQTLMEDYADQLPPDAKKSIERVSANAHRMGHLVDGLLSISRLSRATINKQEVNLSEMARQILETLALNDSGRRVSTGVEQEIFARGDFRLLDVVLTNLLGNAWKFTKRVDEAQIQFGRQKNPDVFFVRDNGAGFDMRYSEKLFGTFQRLHSQEEFEGHGIGLATVKSIIEKHGGKIWAESELNKGATFYFTLN